MQGVTIFSGLCYRMKLLSAADDILGPVRSPMGRSHYDGQKALYLSTSPEGTIVATRVYYQETNPPRAIFPLRVTDARIVDLRDPMATQALEIDTTHRQANWREITETGARSPTWDISDRVRDLGLDGMLYESRSQPGITHLTLFRWNGEGAASVVREGLEISVGD